MDWIIYSLIAAVGFGAISLILTYLTRLHISSLTINTWFWLVTAAMFLLASFLGSSRKLKIPSSSVKWFVLLAIVAVITNFFSVKALQTGPNAGVVRSIQMVQILVATMGAYFIFHQGLGVRAGIGTLLVVVGLILVVNK